MMTGSCNDSAGALWKFRRDDRRIPSFAPLPASLPPREPCGEHCDAQLQSAFLTLLPPEIRNEIYQYVFSSWSAADSLQADHHPLSLLLSCHAINHEATNLAFNTYAFVLPPRISTSYVMFKIQMAHLSSDQTSAITTLAYDLGKSYLHRGGETANMLTNAILLLPSLKFFQLNVRNGLRPTGDVHSTFANPIFDPPPNENAAAITKYASWWLSYGTLQRIVEGSTFSWQKGQKWHVHWPQLKSEYLQIVDGRDAYGHPQKIPYMGKEAADQLRGVHMCVCDCGKVSWTSADLVQETGRIVHMDMHFYSGPEYPNSGKIRPGKLGVCLQPGARPEGEPEDPEYRLSEDTRQNFQSGDDVNKEFYKRMRRRKNWAFASLLKAFYNLRR